MLEDTNSFDAAHFEIYTQHFFFLHFIYFFNIPTKTHCRDGCPSYVCEDRETDVKEALMVFSPNRSLD